MVAALGWTIERKRVLKEDGRRGRLRSVGRWSGPVAWAFSYSKSVSRHHTIASASLFLTLIAQGPAGFRHSLPTTLSAAAFAISGTASIVAVVAADAVVDDEDDPLDVDCCDPDAICSALSAPYPLPMPPSSSSSATRHTQTPTCVRTRVRSTQDAHKLFFAVQRGLLPLVRRRLDAEERLALAPGNVYVWEERPASADGPGPAMERFTEGKRWSQSRVREVNNSSVPPLWPPPYHTPTFTLPSIR
jgi:hypothetical protein